MTSQFATMQQVQRGLIRKATQGSVFIGESSAPAIDETTLFDATSGDLSALPATYTDLGMLTSDGAKFARSVTETNISSWQSATPSRSDVTSDTSTLVVACQETKARTISLYTGATSPQPAHKNGVLRINQPATPSSKFYRVLAISTDQTPGGEVVIARFLPNAQVSDFDDQAYANGADATLWGVTFTAYKDDTLGTPMSYIFGGAGWLAMCQQMGFTVPAN